MYRSEDTSVPTAPGASQSSLLARRHKTLPSRSHRANPSTVDSASPEVISSLISSLSTISIPLQSHFDNVPRIEDTDPSSPDFLQPPPSPLDCGFGVNDGPYKSTEELPHSPFLHPDDAAASPVIRMARAPPSPKSKSTFAADPPSLRPVSRGSYTSSKAVYEDSSFGTITAEPGPRISTTPSIASETSERRKSFKGQLGLLKKTSREFTSSKDRQAERLRKTSSYNDSLRHNVPRNRASLRSMHSMADLAEEGRSNSLVTRPPRENASSAPPSRERHSLQSVRESATGPGGIGSGRVIPARESSLRHSLSSSSKKRKSARHSRYSSTGSKDMKVDSGVFSAGGEAEQVTRRIQELKDQQQKIKTELETDNSPARPTIPESSKQVGSQPVPAEIDEDQVQSDMNHNSDDFEESAPSPAIMTGKSSTKIRTNPPVMSKTNWQPPAARQSIERSDRSEKAARRRRSLEPSTPTRHHRRLPSAQLSPSQTSTPDERRLSVDSIDIAVSDYVSSPKLTQRLSHPTTGRTIAFSEVGDPKGHVVLCCLGMGLTRYLMAFYDELARTLKLRLITLDRPGVGESGPYLEEAGTPLSWPGKHIPQLL